MRRVVLALAALLLVAGGAAGAWYYRDQTRTREKKGSSTVEFVPTRPATKKRPKRSLETVPWPMYGYDPGRTRDPIQFHVRPPFRKLWTLRVGNIIEFPPVVGYGLLVVNQLRGRLFAVNAATGKRQWRRHYLHCAAASPVVGKDVLYVAYMQPYPCKRYPRTQRGFLAAILIRNRKGVLLKKTRWGLHTVAVGGNRIGASEAGINTKLVVIRNFMLCSVLAGLTGVLESVRIASTDPTAGGANIMFQAISAAVIGGTLLAGGSGTVIGAFIGATFLGVLRDGFTIQGVSAFTFDLILGVAILVAMVINVYVGRLRTGGARDG